MSRAVIMADLRRACDLSAAKVLLRRASALGIIAFGGFLVLCLHLVFQTSVTTPRGTPSNIIGNSSPMFLLPFVLAAGAWLIARAEPVVVAVVGLLLIGEVMLGLVVLHEVQQGLGMRQTILPPSYTVMLLLFAEYVMAVVALGAAVLHHLAEPAFPPKFQRDYTTKPPHSSFTSTDYAGGSVE